jgi:hypothetical protein
MYKQTDPDYWPAANWIGPSNPNMKIMGWAAIALGALTLDKHPKAQEWLGLGLQNLRRHLDESASADGAWLECPGYDGAGIAPLVSVALALRKKGRDDLIADGRLLKVALAHAYLMTPPDPRVGNLRHLPEYGDTFDLRTDPTAARARPTYWKDFALAVKDKQPREAAQILWMLGEKDGAAPLDGQSRQLAGFGSVFRHAFNTPDESYLAVHQDSFSFGHYHWDLGALYFFGLGAPLAVDWPSLYAPQINQAWRHNGVSVARQERFAYQGRVEKSALTPRADYSRSRVFYDTAFPPAKLSSAHAQREQAALPDLPGNKPGLASPDLKAKARENAQLNPLAAGPGSLLPLASDDVPEHCWQRQVVFVKGLNSQAYVVVRDAVTDTRPTEWNLWTLSDKLRLAPLRADVTGLYGVNLSVNFFIGPDTTPTTEMFGFGEPPAGTPAGEVKRATVAPGVTEITVPRRHLMQQNAVRLTSASGGAYGAVLFPYRPGTKPPAIYKGANETVTVTTDAGTDTIFLSPTARTATVGDITLQGRAAVVSRAGRNITLQLLEGDMLTIANGPGIRGVGPITLEASDNAMVVQLDGAAREIEIVLPAGLRGHWTGNIPGVMLLGREKDRMRLKVAAGKHDFRISVSARESQNSQ